MNPWRGLKDLPKNMWTLFAATLINRSGTMVLPFLAVYLTQKVGISPAKAGLVLTFYGLGALFTSPIIGRVSDRIGALRIMKFSLIISGIVMFAYSFFQNYYMIIAITFIMSIISEAFRPANLSLISEIVNPNQRRPAYALNRLAINIGMSIGPVVGGFLALINFHILFYVDGITSILAGLFLIFNYKEEKLTHIKDKRTYANVTASIKKQNIFFDSRLLYFLLALLPIVMVYFQHQAAMPVFLVQELHFSAATYGILFTINTVLIILVEVPLNNSLTHWSDKKLLSIGSILCGIGFGAMAFTKDIYSIALSIVIWTFAEMIIFPTSSAYMSEIAPKDRRGEYMGIYQSGFNLAYTIGPWLGTAVLENFGSTTLWIGTFFFGVISAILMLGLKPKPDLVEDNI